jgi:hypothetical protein
MRIAAVLLALTISSAGAAQTISDEFGAGFGGVPWGIEFSALLMKFPGGFAEFSTAPGRVSYALNIDDSVLGISRRAQYVVFGMGVDGKVDVIEIQVPYDKTSTLISTLTSKFGPEAGIEGTGVITTYRWPPDKEIAIRVRTTKNRVYGLTTLVISRNERKSDSRQPRRKPT